MLFVTFPGKDRKRSDLRIQGDNGPSGITTSVEHYDSCSGRPPTNESGEQGYWRCVLLEVCISFSVSLETGSVWSTRAPSFMPHGQRCPVLGKHLFDS